MMLSVRPAIKDAESYVPGKPVVQFKREFKALAARRIIKLASNENPLGPSPKAVAAIRKGAQEIYRYPESSSPLLRNALASHLGISPDEILAASGVDEALRLIAETWLDQGDCCVVSQYTFSRYRQHAQLMGVKVAEVPVLNFHIDLKQMALAALDRQAKVLFIANPNNPTSTFNTDQELKALFRQLGPDGPVIVLDEAYGEFARDAYPELYPNSIPSYFKLYPKLIVLRTLSKIMGLAGMRIGYCVAEKELIAYMNKAKLVFNVTSLSQLAAVEALKDRRHYERTLKVTGEGRRYLEGQLKSLGFDVVGPGAANFVFVKVPQGSGFEIYRKLLNLGIIIRPLSEKGLGSYVRISIGTLSENRMLVRALKNVLQWN